MHTYEVTVDGYGGSYFAGATAGKARAKAWRSFQSACDCTFKEFLRRSKIAKVELPPGQGYEYVKRAYGVDARAGQRVKLRHEGVSWNGKTGAIVYPGASTAHVHVIMDDTKDVLIVHPDNIETLQQK